MQSFVKVITRTLSTAEIASVSGHITPFKVIQGHFLLVNDTDLHPILYHLPDIAFESGCLCHKNLFSETSENIATSLKTRFLDYISS